MVFGLRTRAELLACLLALGHCLVRHIDQRLRDLRLQLQFDTQLQILLDFLQARFDSIKELILGQCGMWTLLKKRERKREVLLISKSSSRLGLINFNDEGNAKRAAYKLIDDARREKSQLGRHGMRNQAEHNNKGSAGYSCLHHHIIALLSIEVGKQRRGRYCAMNIKLSAASLSRTHKFYDERLVQHKPKTLWNILV